MRGVDRVIQRRREERDAILEDARAYVESLAGKLDVWAAVVVGSVARGDFNLWSDIDVLIVAEGLPERLLDRLSAVEPRPPGFQPIPWSPRDWARELARGNPIAMEAARHGVWLRGSTAELQAIDG